ncbi:beta-propeller domain-containing protein [Actinocorallia sp. API 0066]|uniref:beta-propeller domain-containing protein n=1 Tax=Actinocorallia sp. API 0066 TaxID=2896846 RepID=UPI001E2FE984|nr:beta-propeller domain-containing protein [Actinocorallia sp. API 0066]MCD0448363.1 beta-propeller domain-containing protein [Actinocorallia sp. API 0066]
MITPTVLLLVTACSPSAADAPPGLVGRQDCAALLESLRTATLARTGPLGVEGSLDPSGGGPAAVAPVPADDPSAAADLPDTVELLPGGAPRALAAAGRRLFVLDGRDGSVQRRIRLPRGYETARVLSDGSRALLLTGHDPDGTGPGAPVARLLLVDLATGGTLGELRMPGVLVDARRSGPLVRVSVRALPRLDFAAPPSKDDSAWNDYAPRAVERNKDVVRDAPAEAFHPAYDVTVSGETVRHRVPCNRINRPRDDVAESVLTVFTFDLSKPLGDGAPLAVAGGHAAVHGTATSLYVAETPPGTATTRVHRIDLTPDRPLYVGSGSVVGEVLGPGGLSEHKGHLRVAVGDPGRTVGDLYVLETSGPRLDTIGRLIDVSGDSGIRAVRFLGDRAYVTTDRAKGPLPALDLSDPAHPRRLGELPFPAASTSLLPSAEGRVVAVGQPRTGRGRPQGLRVSLFGPSADGPLADLRGPGLPGARVEHDPRAYLHDPATGLTVLPTVPHAAAVLSVTPQGVTRLGTLRHRSAPITRALLVGDTLLTFSSAGVMVSDAARLKRRAWTAF